MKQVVRFVSDASSKATQAAIDKLFETGEVSKESLQRVIAKGDELTTAVSDFIQAKIRELGAAIKSCLKLISGGKSIVIGETDGKETLAKAKDLFTGFLDGDFKAYGTDHPAAPTKAMPVEVYEMVENADFRKLFGGFQTELDKLCLTQAQIKSFVKNHSDWLRKDGYATFFLFKVEDKFFVAVVYVYSDGLHAYVCRLGGDDVWCGEDQHRVVVPQQTLAS
ncbi:MAG TPA: hypothetical protein VMR73_01210 [Candidatus Paceibacterota bacterium]|nr:hypothetical protein [Candidatus Paceibacterota bacterium]